jgi:hypothetical protein
MSGDGGIFSGNGIKKDAMFGALSVKDTPFIKQVSD